MAELTISPAMTVAMSAMVAMVSLLLTILCVLRRKNTDSRGDQLGDEDTAFHEYRKQQQARSVEDLATAQDLVSAESVEAENQTNLARAQSNHTGTSPVVNLPGADLIDQFPDQQHIYRLDPTEDILNSVASATGNQGQRPVTMAIGENVARAGHSRDVTAEYTKVNKKPITEGPLQEVTAEYAKVNKKPMANGNQSQQVTAEYAEVNKKPKLPDKKNGGIRASMPASAYELEHNVIFRVDTQNASTDQGSQYDNVRRVMMPSPYTGDTSLKVPDIHQTHGLFPPTRDISTRSTGSYMSDFQDCTEFRRDPLGN